MIWLFQKGTAQLRVETKFDLAACDYVAVLHSPDGTQHIARFCDEVTFREYLLNLEQRLSRERWEYDRRPAVLLERSRNISAAELVTVSSHSG